MFIPIKTRLQIGHVENYGDSLRTCIRRQFSIVIYISLFTSHQKDIITWYKSMD